MANEIKVASPKFPEKETTPFKIQLCFFRRKNGKTIEPWEKGIAWVTYFNGDVERIIDAYGTTIAHNKLYDFKLISGERSCIDSHMDDRLGSTY